jgi:dipeptidyl aminopeptidase/acylaminoacyl peptidase
MNQPFRVQDLYLHQKISDLHCTTSSDAALCTVVSVDREADGYVSCVWCFPLDGSAPRQMTHGPGRDESPRWSPDGSQLAFLSSRAGSPQVYLMRRDGGEARPLGKLPQSVSNLRWAPDGRSLVVAAAVEVDPDLHGGRGREAKAPRKKNAPEVAWRLPYKEDGVGYLLQREFHLFRLDVESGAHRRLTDGVFDVLAFDVASDGRIAYSRTRDGRFAHNNDLWVCDADGKNARRLTSDHAIVMAPHWSPDGRHIAFTGAREEGDAEPRLWLVEVESGRVHALLPDTLDVAHPESLHWDADGKRLVLTRAHRGRHQIVSLHIEDHALEVMAAGDRQLGVFGCTAGHLVYSIDHPSLPSELWRRARSDSGHRGKAVQAQSQEGSVERQLSTLNPWWRDRAPVDAQPIEFDVPDGLGGTERIEGWLLRAKGSRQPQPVLNDVHGGPASYALLDYDTNIFWQVLCAKGWAVLALNAVGSASYGREFCRRLAGRWGSCDLPQHLAALAELEARGICDGRIAVSGKSYGGYLSGYATGNSDRFSAAVVMAPVGNIETHYGTSDGGYYADPFYMASKPEFDRSLAVQLSPLHHITKSNTPTLFMQGKDDERCPKCQSEELFVSLARAGDTPAELVLYPGETHGFLGSGAPSCREDAANRIIAWMERHAMARPQSVPPREPVEIEADA